MGFCQGDTRGCLGPWFAVEYTVWSLGPPMNALFLVITSVAPSLAILWWFTTRDQRPEPRSAVWLTFGLGVLAVAPALVVALPVDAIVEHSTLDNPYAIGLVQAFFSAAIPEECIKYLILADFCSRHWSFGEPMDGVVYGVAASLGFAALENLLYVADGGLLLALARGLTAVPSHAMMGAVMGYYIGQAGFTFFGRRLLLAKGLAIPILLHGLYDFPVLTVLAAEDLDQRLGLWPHLLLYGLLLAVLGLELWWAMRLVRKLRGGQTDSLAQAQLPGGPAPAPTAGPWASALSMILGGLLAMVGAAFALAAIVVLVGGEPTPEELPNTLLVGCVLGGIPLLGGGVILAWGLRQTARRSAVLHASPWADEARRWQTSRPRPSWATPGPGRRFNS